MKSWSRHYIFRDLFSAATTWKYMTLNRKIVKSDILWCEHVKCTIYFPWKRELGTPIAPSQGDVQKHH